MKTATAEVRLKSLQLNLERVRRLAPKSHVLAVLKANAYGHGLLPVAKTLEDHADAFGVARINEAIALREGGVEKTPIVLMEGFVTPEHLPLLNKYQLESVIHSPEQLSQFLEAELDEPIQIWLKVDTGMNRLGIPVSQCSEFYQSLSQSPNVKSPIRIMTHFPCADDIGSQMTDAQITVFDDIDETKATELSLCNSAGVIAWPKAHRDWVRPGIMLYGVSPMLGCCGPEHGLEPAMRMTSSIISIKEVEAGQYVGYGATWKSNEKTKIAVVAIGYGDGYPRHAPSGTPVYVNGREVPLAGRVSMDMICIDLGPDAQDKVGDEVILWGPELPIEKIATFANTIGYELLCNITGRVDIRYIKS